MAKNQFSLMTPDERAECGRIGGIKSGETRRNNRKFKDTVNIVLSMPTKNGKLADIESVKNFSQLKGKNTTIQDAIVIAMLQKAIQGNVRAAEWLRDTCGQKPTENMNIEQTLAPIVISGGEKLED